MRLNDADLLTTEMIKIPGGIPSFNEDMAVGFLNGVVETRSGLTMVTYSLSSHDLHDGAEIKLPREEQKQ
jgi:hypothetical protein